MHFMNFNYELGIFKKKSFAPNWIQKDWCYQHSVCNINININYSLFNTFWNVLVLFSTEKHLIITFSDQLTTHSVTFSCLKLHFSLSLIFGYNFINLLVNYNYFERFSLSFQFYKKADYFLLKIDKKIFIQTRSIDYITKCINVDILKLKSVNESLKAYILTPVSNHSCNPSALFTFPWTYTLFYPPQQGTRFVF